MQIWTSERNREREGTMSTKWVKLGEGGGGRCAPLETQKREWINNLMGGEGEVESRLGTVVGGRGRGRDLI